MTAVFDFASISARRRELAPHDLPPIEAHTDIYGSRNNHCSSCPIADGEPCVRPCYDVRKEMQAKDGVSVT